jgi:ABC-type branched-subunit amino acid transport system ATPase component
VVPACSRGSYLRCPPAEQRLQVVLTKNGMSEEERLKREGTSILVVEQNARPVFEIAHRVSVLERGHITMSGTPAELVGDVRVMEAYLGGGVRSPQ